MKKKKTPETSKADYVTVYLYIIASGLHLQYTFCFFILVMTLYLVNQLS